MARPDETFIVRVRHREGDAVVEQPRLARRILVRDLTQVGPAIARWLSNASHENEPTADSTSTAHARRGC